LRETKSDYGVNHRRTSIAFRTYLGPLDSGGHADAPSACRLALPVKWRRAALVGCESGIDAAATPFWCALSATLLCYSGHFGREAAVVRRHSLADNRQGRMAAR
jgi:hypothetical protein